MKTTVKKVSLVLAAALMLSLLAACGPKHAEGSASVDVMTTAGSGCLQAQVSSMLGVTTELELVIDGDSYTLTKHLVSAEDPTSQGGKVDVTYTFTGTVSKAEGDTYTLAPAAAVSYSIVWGPVAPLADMGLMPTAEGSGTQDDDPTALNWFYTPYLKDNGGNSDSMEITVKDGTLTFAGFSLTEEE